MSGTAMATLQWRISCGGVQSRPRPCWRLYLTPTPLEQTNGRPSVPDRTDCFGLLPLDSLGHRRWGKRDGRLYCLHCTLFCPCPWKFADNIGKIAVADRQHRARRRQRRLLWIPPELLSKQKTGPKVPDKVVRTGECGLCVRTPGIRTYRLLVVPAGAILFSVGFLCTRFSCE